MLFLKILCSALFATGLFILLSARLRLPSRKAVRALRKVTGTQPSFQQSIVRPLAFRLAPYIRIAPYKRQDMADRLTLAGKTESPEFVVAAALIVAGISVITGLVFMPVTPWITVILTAYGIYYFIKMRGGDTSAADKWREGIQTEMPRFAIYLEQAVKSRHDMYAVISDYRSTAGQELGKELDTVLVGIRTKGAEYALQQFGARMGDPLVSDLVMGLIGTLHGDDMGSFMAGVAARFNEEDIARLEREADKRPEALNPANILLLVCMIAVLFTALGIQAYQSYSLLNY